MKITIKASDEKSFPLDVPSAVSVRDVKLRVELLNNIPLDQQRLLYYGRELKDDQLLDSSGVQDESILHLAVRMPNGFPIVIKNKGKSIPVTVLPTDGLKSIKIFIQGSEGYPVREQRLFFQGVELENDRTLLSYNIQPGSNLDLQVPDSPQMQIHVKTLSGKTASLDVKPSDKIIAVKAMIKEQLDISADKQHLVYIDKPLDNNRTLADYDIRDGGVIFLVFRLLGGV